MPCYKVTYCLNKAIFLHGTLSMISVWGNSEAAARYHDPVVLHRAGQISRFDTIFRAIVLYFSAFLYPGLIASDSSNSFSALSGSWMLSKITPFSVRIS